MSCLVALPNVFVPGWTAVVEPPAPCLAVQADVSGRVARVVPDTGIATRIELSRARLAVALADGPLRAAVRTSAVRSAGDAGYVGIDGEAPVLEVDAAVAGVVSERRGLHGELGIVPDLWVTSADRAWGLAGVQADLGTAAGWMERADLGAQGGIVAPGGLLTVDLALTTGEGFAIRERNEGKDLALQVSAAPFAASDRYPRALVVTAYGRDGSRGIGYARSSRLGARIAGEVPRLGYGAEVLAAWGVDADAARTPVGGSAWLRGSPVEPLYGVVRVDRWSEGRRASGTLVLAAAGARLDRTDLGDPSGSRLVALAGVARTDLGPGLTPVAGADVFAVGTTWFVQLDALMRGSTDSGRPAPGQADAGGAPSGSSPSGATGSSAGGAP